MADEHTPIRVLHLRNCRGIRTLTGPETYLLDLMRNVDTDRFDLTLGCIVNARHPSLMFLDALEQQSSNTEVISTRGPLDYRDFRRTLQLIKARRIDILQTHDARSDFIGSMAARLSGVPLMTFAHGWVNWTSAISKDHLYAWLESCAVNLSDYIVSASKAVANDVQRRGADPSKIELVPFGIDAERFRPLACRARIRSEFGIARETLLIGTVSRLHPWKGHRYLVEAAALLARTHTSFKLLWVGDAAFEGHARFREELESHIASLGLSERIIMTGSRRDVPEIMSGLDLFVLPSVREPFGLVLLEVQACGIPIVATRVDGIPEVVDAGKAGVLVAPEDPEALASAIRDLLDAPGRRQEIGSAGRLHVMEKFTTQIMGFASDGARHGRRRSRAGASELLRDIGQEHQRRHDLDDAEDGCITLKTCWKNRAIRAVRSCATKTMSPRCRMAFWRRSTCSMSRFISSAVRDCVSLGVRGAVLNRMTRFSSASSVNPPACSRASRAVVTPPA